MQDNIEKSDLRIIKTAKVLNASMFALLEKNEFKKITVRDICEEAQISRATFYARYADKFDFLNSWLINLKPDGIDKKNAYDEMEKILNDFIYKNKQVITNLVCDADSETLGIISEFMILAFQLTDEYNVKKMTSKQIVLFNFFAGGMIYYFQWHAKNNFSSGITPMNMYLHEIIQKLKDLEVDAL